MASWPSCAFARDLKCRAFWNLDHIFYKGVKPVRFQTVTTPNYGVAYLSDHYPITLTVE